MTQDELIDAIVADLFSSGDGRWADRLVLTGPAGVIGEWTRQALREHLKVLLLRNGDAVRK